MKYTLLILVALTLAACGPVQAKIVLPTVTPRIVIPTPEPTWAIPTVTPRIVQPEILQAITPIPFYCVCGEVDTSECIAFCKELDSESCYDVGSLEAKEACEAPHE